MDENRYKIGELAELANVTKRTVHYYLSRGLLPPSEGAGIATTYSDEHLYRILLIKKYQESFLPLDEIKKIITRLTLDQVKEKLESDYEENNFIIYETETPSYYTGESIYKKVTLDYGVEIHYPIEDENANKLVEKILSENKKGE